jgi:hypothetical protein
VSLEKGAGSGADSRLGCPATSMGSAIAQSVASAVSHRDPWRMREGAAFGFLQIVRRTRYSILAAMIQPAVGLSWSV